MTLANVAWRGGGAIVGATLCTVLALGQSVPSFNGPLRTAPTEKFTVNPGFRDWAPTTIAGMTILGGNSSNRGGLFADDTLSGKVKWTSRPTGLPHGNPFVSTKPAVSGDIVIAPMGHTLVALSLATGNEFGVVPTPRRERRSPPTRGRPTFWGRTTISTRWTRLPAVKNGRSDSLAAAARVIPCRSCAMAPCT